MPSRPHAGKLSHFKTPDKATRKRQDYSMKGHQKCCRKSLILSQYLLQTTSHTSPLIRAYGELDRLTCFQNCGPPTSQTSCRCIAQGNQLLCLEPSLRQLQSLQCLDVSSNMLQNLDDCLATLKRLPNLTDLMIQVSQALAAGLTARLHMSPPY